MPSFNVYTLRMKFQKLLDIMKDAQDYPDRQYVHSHCTVGKNFCISRLKFVVFSMDTIFTFSFTSEYRTTRLIELGKYVFYELYHSNLDAHASNERLFFCWKTFLL